MALCLCFFTLYNASTAGTALWTETQTLAVSSGKLNALLGSVTALNLPFDQDYYLGVKSKYDSEMSPRYRIASSAYAYPAKQEILPFILTNPRFPRINPYACRYQLFCPVLSMRAPARLRMITVIFPIMALFGSTLALMPMTLVWVAG